MNCKMKPGNKLKSSIFIKKLITIKTIRKPRETGECNNSRRFRHPQFHFTRNLLFFKRTLLPRASNLASSQQTKEYGKHTRNDGKLADVSHHPLRAVNLAFNRIYQLTSCTKMIASVKTGKTFISPVSGTRVISRKGQTNVRMK